MVHVVGSEAGQQQPIASIFLHALNKNRVAIEADFGHRISINIMYGINTGAYCLFYWIQIRVSYNL
jgi:hypothetical protein